MSTIQPYSGQLNPPAPALDIFLSRPDEFDWDGPYLAMLDSGADMTIVPLSMVRSLGAPVYDQVVLISQWGDRYPMHLYQVDIQIAGIVLPVISVAGDAHSNEVLLGRNVLNRLDLRLEGPNLRTHLLGD